MSFASLNKRQSVAKTITLSTLLTDSLFLEKLFSDWFHISHLSFCVVDVEFSGAMQFEARHICELEPTGAANYFSCPCFGRVCVDLLLLHYVECGLLFIKKII